MLELLLRIFGLKRRKRRGYVPGSSQGARASRGAPERPSAPGPAETLQRNAERQTAEQALRLRRTQAKRKAGLLARLGLTSPKAALVPITPPPPPPEPAAATEAAAPVASLQTTPQAERASVPPPAARQTRRKARPPAKKLGQIWRELRAEIGASWGGPIGSAARGLVRGLLIYVAPVVIVGVPGYYVVEEMRAVGVEVQGIAVPEAVARTGRSPDVLARLLIDQVDAIRHDVQLDRTDRWPEDIASQQASFALASEADTLHRVAIFLRGLTPRPARIVTGVITQQTDGSLSLRIYMTGMNHGAPVAALEGFSMEELNRVVAGAAPLLVRAVSPGLYAWRVAQTEPRSEALQTTLHALISDPASGTVDPGTANTVDFLLVRNLAKTGRADDAFELAEALVRRAPTYPPGYYAKALALVAQGEGDAALAAADQARQLDGGRPWSYKVVGDIQLATGHLADALQNARVARRLTPSDGSAMILEANTLLVMRRVDEAAAVVRVALERAPGQPGVMEIAASVMLARGRPDIAVSMINNELRLRPDRVSALIVKARLLSAMGRGADALEAANAALRLQPSNGVAQAARGYALVANGRPTEALTLFTQLKAASPTNPTVLQGRAMALAKLGRKDEAIEEFQAVLELAPDFAAARRELTRLQGGTPPPLPGTATAPSVAAKPAALKPANGNFIAAPIDVGPAPAPAIPKAETSQMPVESGTFTNQRNQPPGQFRRPDSDPDSAAPSR